MQGRARFLTGSTLGHVVRMTMTGSLAITFVFLIDAANLFWVSLLGDEQMVAALGFGWTIQFFTISTGVGLMIAATALVSRAIGRDERERARNHATGAAALAVAVVGVIAAYVVIFRHELVALAGGEGRTAEMAARYLLISVPSMPIMALGLVGSAVLRAEGDAWRAMTVTVTGGSLSMVADPVLIWGLGLGLDGAAINVVLARSLSCAVSVYFVIRVHDLFAPLRAAVLRATLRPYAAIAVPAFVAQIAAPFGNLIVTRAISDFGDGAVAGWAVVARVTLLAFGGIFALSAAIGGIFGQNFGAGRLDRVRTTLRDALLFCAAYTALTWAVLAALTEPLVAAFGLSADGAPVLRAFTLIAAGAFMFNGALFVANSAFNNLGRPSRAMALSWVRDGVFLYPAVLWAGANWAAPGVIYGQGLAGVAVGVPGVALAYAHLRRLDAAQGPRTPA